MVSTSLDQRTILSITQPFNRQIAISLTSQSWKKMQAAINLEQEKLPSFLYGSLQSAPISALLKRRALPDGSQSP